MTDPRAWLDAVDARTNAATDGPWERDRTYPLGHPGPYSISVRSPQVTVSDGLTKRDAEFIASARADLPAATTALRAVLDRHARRPYDTIRDGVTFEQTDYPDLCTECRQTFPCPTVTAITTPLEDA